MGMEEAQLAEFLDQQRWLLNNGLVPDSIKNQLFYYGTIVHSDVQAVELKLNPEIKSVDYVIYVDKSLMKKIDRYKKLSTATSLLGLWLFKRFLKREGSLDFHSMLNSFVRDFCGPHWVAKVSVIDFDGYVDNIGVEGGPAGQSNEADQSSN